jgi:hypothetical protein
LLAEYDQDIEGHLKKEYQVLTVSILSKIERSAELSEYSATFQQNYKKILLI